jgi:hypothetical protein
LTTAAILLRVFGGLDQHQSTARGAVSLMTRGDDPCEERPMRAAWKIFCLSAIVLAAAVGLAHLLVPDVVPVGYAEEPQASWAILTAFALRAIALTAAWVAVITISVLVGTKLYRTFFRAAQRAE